MTKFLMLVFGLSKKRRKLADYYQESVNKIGREQFRKLTEKGLRIPVALL